MLGRGVLRNIKKQKVICDQACENMACVHMIFAYLFNLSELITFYMLWQ